MNDGVMLWLGGPAPEVAAALAQTLTGATCWPVDADTVCAVASQTGEHLSACVERVVRGAQIASRQGAAVGLAVGPLATAGQVNPTAERARRAAALASAGEIILAWGSQAYVRGTFESVSTGFVRLIELA